MLSPDLQPVDCVKTFADVCSSGEGRNRRLLSLDGRVQLVFDVLTIFHRARFGYFAISHSNVRRMF